MENIVKSFDIFPYVCDKHDNIWKYTKSGYFIKLSPWKAGEDRRINCYEIEELIKRGKLVQYAQKQKIFEKLNKRWDNSTHEWEYNGNHFEVELPSKRGTDFFKAPKHKFERTYKDASGNEHTYYSEYRLVFYNGNMYWANPYHYWPQVVLFNFESIDKCPDTGINGYMRWTKGTHLRPIYCTNKCEYI